MKKLRNFFREIKSEWKSRYNTAMCKDEKIYEVELWGIEGEGINTDEYRSWEVIKELYQDILIDDDNWHFFYENYYNIIRCSASFYPRVIQRLIALGIYYKEKGEWVDGQRSTRKHQKIFQQMFHCFTLLALKEYDSGEIAGIYDRVSHCFLNHQFFVLEDVRKEQGRHWEAHIMTTTATYRADHSAYLYYKGYDPSKSIKIDVSEKPLLDQIKEGSFERITEKIKEESE